MGLIVGQKSRPKGFADPTPSELSKFWKDDENQRKMEADTMVKGANQTVPVSDIKSVDILEGRDPYLPP